MMRLCSRLCLLKTVLYDRRDVRGPLLLRVAFSQGTILTDKKAEVELYWLIVSCKSRS